VTTTADTQRYWTPTPADLPNVEAVARHYWDSAAAPHRAWVVAALAVLGDVQSVLDLGCQCGPNLRVLHDHYPHLQLIGLDCNPQALAFGRQWLPEADFLEGVLPDALTSWGDHSVDVVLSTYTLAYQSPDTIEAALAHCLRIARRAVILIEPMPNPDPERIDVAGSDYVEWRHPYGVILGWLVTQHGARTFRWEPMPRYDTLSGALIITPTGGLDAQ